MIIGCLPLGTPLREEKIADSIESRIMLLFKESPICKGAGRHRSQAARVILSSARLGVARLSRLAWVVSSGLA